MKGNDIVPIDYCIFIKKLRTECGISQEALAEYLGCSVSSIQKYESGKRKPSEETYQAMLELFFKIRSGVTSVEGLLKTLDEAVIEAASGDDSGMIRFFKEFTEVFQFKDYYWKSFDEMLLDDIKAEKIDCNFLNQFFFNGEELIVKTDNEVCGYNCSNPLLAMEKLYDFGFCDWFGDWWLSELDENLKNVYDADTRGRFMINIFKITKYIVFLSLKNSYRKEINQDKVVQYNYKVFAPLRKELKCIFMHAINDWEEKVLGDDLDDAIVSIALDIEGCLMRGTYHKGRFDKDLRLHFEKFVNYHK